MGERELEMDRATSRLNMWSLYTSVSEGILEILDMWRSFNGWPSSGEAI